MHRWSNRWGLVLLLAMPTVLWADETPANLPSDAEIADLILQLGDEDVAARESAFKKLAQIGFPAETQLKAAQYDPEFEVRLGAVRLLKEIELSPGSKQEFKARLDAFAADTDGSQKRLLPGWRAYRRIVGDSPDARKLFVQMQQVGRSLLRAYAEGTIEIDPVRDSVFDETLAGLGQVGLPEWTASVAALLLVAGDDSTNLSQQSQSQLAGSLLDEKVTQALAGEYGAVFRKLLGHWVENSSDIREGIAGMGTLQLALRHDLPEAALALASQLLQEKPALEEDAQVKSLRCFFALMALTKVGNQAHLELIEPLLDDQTPLGDFVQVRDIALAAAVRLSGQSRDDYGLKDVPFDKGLEGLGPLMADGILKDPPSRDQVIAKWRTWMHQDRPKVEIEDKENALRYDWPGWRGAKRDGLSPETGLLQSWPEEGPELLWASTQAGTGYTGITVMGERFYTAGADKEKEFLYAFDVNTGKRLWATEIGKQDHQDDFWGAGPKSTAATDGEHVVILGGQGNLVCVEAQSGKLVWVKRYAQDFQGTGGTTHGRYCESPLLDGDRVICTPGGPAGCVVALDKKTGQTLWRTTDFQDTGCLSSAIVAELGGVHQYVLQTQANVVGISPESGELLWRFPRPQGACPTPIVTGDFVFVASEFNPSGCHLLKVTRDGEQFRCEEVYRGDDKHDKFYNVDGGCCVLVDNRIYGYNRTHGGEEGRHNRSWVCFDWEKGEFLWGYVSEDKLGRGCLMYADGRLYCYDEIGTVVLLEANPKKWKEHGRFFIPSKSLSKGVGTYPTIVNGRLYLRNQKHIYCYDIKAPARQE